MDEHLQQRRHVNSMWICAATTASSYRSSWSRSRACSMKRWLLSGRGASGATHSTRGSAGGRPAAVRASLSSRRTKLRASFAEAPWTSIVIVLGPTFVFAIDEGMHQLTHTLPERVGKQVRAYRVTLVVLKTNSDRPGSICRHL